MGIPTGGYPKMVTGTAANGNTVPLVFPSGDAKQFTYVIFNSAADERAYTGNGVAPVSTVSSGGSNSWENRHGGKGS